MPRSFPKPVGRSERVPPSRCGFTLVELVITMAILLVASGILARTLAGTSGMRTVNRENALSIEGGRRVLEEMRDMPFEDLFRLFNEADGDDPLGPGTAPGSRFVVEGLEPLAGAGGQHGTIEFPAMLVEVIVEEEEEGLELELLGLLGGEPRPPKTELVWQVREDVVDPELGMPRDLNGDSKIDSEDHSQDYIILPVRVRMEWDGVGGERSTQLHTMFTEFSKKL